MFLYSSFAGHVPWMDKHAAIQSLDFLLIELLIDCVVMRDIEYWVIHKYALSNHRKLTD